MKKIFYLGLFLFLFIPFVSANSLIVFSAFTIPFMPILFAIEGFCFWLSANNFFKVKIKFWKCFWIIVVANLASSFVGTMIELIFPNIFSILTEILGSPIGIILISFILTSLIEFGTYILFLNKKNIKKLNLFWTSLIVNSISYVIILIIYKILQMNNLSRGFPIN